MDLSGLRLALFTDTWAPQVNGVAMTLQRLVAAVEHRGGAVRVITPDDPARQPGEASMVTWPSASFWSYPQLRVAPPRVYRAAADLAAWRPTLVHAATPFGVGIAGRAAAAKAGLPLVTSYHTHFTQYLQFYGLQALDAVAWPFLRWFHNGGARTFVPTAQVADQLIAQGFERVAVWGRGVDTDRFAPAHRSQAWRSAMGCDMQTHLVLYVGRLSPEKGLAQAMEAMRHVQSQWGDHVRFVLVGDGPEEATLRDAAPAGAVFAGRLDGAALATAYASADLFLFPSTTETFGNVVLEAMASGLPVVAPDAGATTTFATRDCAMLCDVRDPRAIATAVDQLLGDAASRDRLARAARTTALARSWEGVWQALFTEYLQVLAEHRSGDGVRLPRRRGFGARGQRVVA